MRHGGSDASGFPGEVYFEFYALGGAVKVTALCAVTGLEAVVMGPASATQADIERLALNKLKRLLAQRQGPA